jgi:hypothetical protein
MEAPHNLGEAYHLLQAKADVNYWIAMAFKALANEVEASRFFEMSANEQGDFQAMAVTEHSELSYYRGLSLLELNRRDGAIKLFTDLKRFADQISSRRQRSIILQHLYLYCSFSKMTLMRCSRIMLSV